MKFLQFSILIIKLLDMQVVLSADANNIPDDDINIQSSESAAVADCSLIQDTDSQDAKKLKIVLIHGTFARSSSWYQPGGAFFQGLQRWGTEKNLELEILPFKWSGALSVFKRMDAAVSLVELLTSISTDDNVPYILIGHSHGANVAFLASQFFSAATQNARFSEGRRSLCVLLDDLVKREREFAKEVENYAPRSGFDIIPEELLSDETGKFIVSEDELNLYKESLLTRLEACFPHNTKNFDEDTTSPMPPPSIKAIYALGAPIDATVYWPSDDTVGSVYSFYSEGDKIQIYSSQFQRRFGDFASFTPKACQVFDIKLTLGESYGVKGVEHPKHLQLNSGIVGRWILEIPALLEKFTACANKSANQCCYAWAHFFKDLSHPLIKSIKKNKSSKIKI